MDLTKDITVITIEVTISDPDVILSWIDSNLIKYIEDIKSTKTMKEQNNSINLK